VYFSGMYRMCSSTLRAIDSPNFVRILNFQASLSSIAVFFIKFIELFNYNVHLMMVVEVFGLSTVVTRCI